MPDKAELLALKQEYNDKLNRVVSRTDQIYNILIEITRSNLKP